MNFSNVGLLLLRVGFGLMMLLGHGLSKLSNFDSIVVQFPGVLGLSPKFSLGLAVFTEFFCALFVILGLFTKASAALIAITMAVAAFVVHAGQPFAQKEMALLYLVAFTVIALLGAGGFSVEGKRKKGW